MRYLVVEPHPDDLAFFCGGTVAKLIAEGHEVETLVVTDGEQGTLKRSYDTDQKLAAVMREEQRAACEILGVEKVTFLGLKNHFLEPTHDLREKIVRHLRAVQPGAVITLDPWNFDENPDHRAVGQAVLEACSFAHFHLFHPEHLERRPGDGDGGEGDSREEPESEFPRRHLRVHRQEDLRDSLLPEPARADADGGRAAPGGAGQVEPHLRQPDRRGDSHLHPRGRRRGRKAGESSPGRGLQRRGLGILENIKDLVGGLGV